MSQAFLGQIMLFGGSFAPAGWAFCNGQLIAISQNTALFALLGTTYGGDGVTTFALPNLQSRVPVHQGQGPGLSSYVMGESAGSTAVTLLSSQMPSHSHLFAASTASATAASISSNTRIPATPTASGAALYANPGSPALEFQFVQGVQNAGGNQPHSNLMPSLCVTFVIATAGIFPSRN